MSYGPIIAIVIIIILMVAILAAVFTKTDPSPRLTQAPPPRQLGFLKRNEIEHFQNNQLGSMSGFGFTKVESTGPLFANFYSSQMGKDFLLSNLLRKLKMEIQYPTISNGQQFGTQYNSQMNPQNMGKNLSPIIIIPTIGASKIYAKWNKNGTKYVKKLDAYGNFEEAQKWKCKDLQETWTQIWPPSTQIDGLAEYCWVQNATVNEPGVTTTINNPGILDFGTNAYDNLIKSLVSTGYVVGSTLFGFNYDFRTLDINNIATSLTALIEKLARGSNKRVILVGHGLGSMIVNNVLVNRNPMWKDSFVNCFVSISGSFGGAPKALRTLISGEYRPDPNEGKLIRNASANYAGLYWMLPNPTVYGTVYPLILNKSMNVGDIPNIIKQVSPVILNNESMYETFMQVNNSASLSGALKSPGVKTFVLVGTNIPTEIAYSYVEYTDNPYQTVIQSGDGSIPDASLRVPYKWADTTVKIYDSAEHVKIMSMYEPVKDFLNIVNFMNNNFIKNVQMRTF